MMDIPKIPKSYMPIYNAISNAENGITMEKLLIQIGRPDSYKRTVSEIITTLINEYSVPIGSSSNNSAHRFGYFMIETEQDYLLAMRTLESRVGGINERKKQIKKYWKRKGEDDK